MNKFYPKKFKYKKLHKNLRIFKNKENHSNRTKFGTYGIISLSKGTITSKQLLTIDNLIRKKLKPLKNSKYWITIFPNVCLTKKPQKTRMGKGAGAFLDWIYPIKENKVFIEFSNLPADYINDIYILIRQKLNIKIKVIKNYDFSWK